MIGLADFKLIHCLMASDLRPGELFPRGGRVRHRSGGNTDVQQIMRDGGE